MLLHFVHLVTGSFQHYIKIVIVVSFFFNFLNKTLWRKVALKWPLLLWKQLKKQCFDRIHMH